MTDIPALTGPMMPPASGGAPRSVVILLHGYGSNGDDLIGLAPHWRADLPDTAFLSPNAPEPCPGAPGGYQWWSLTSFSPDARAAGVRQAAAVIDHFIDNVLAHFGLLEDRLALVGFSQGTMCSLHVGPRRSRQVAGILGYSGLLADPAALAEARARPPILLVHGDADPMVPVAAFHQASDALSSAGFDLQTHISPGLGHSIDEPGLRLGGAFLARVLA